MFSTLSSALERPGSPTALDTHAHVYFTIKNLTVFQLSEQLLDPAGEGVTLQPMDEILHLLRGNKHKSHPLFPLT